MSKFCFLSLDGFTLFKFCHCPFDKRYRHCIGKIKINLFACYSAKLITDAANRASFEINLPADNFNFLEIKTFFVRKIKAGNCRCVWIVFFLWNWFIVRGKHKHTLVRFVRTFKIIKTSCLWIFVFAIESGLLTKSNKKQ